MLPPHEYILTEYDIDPSQYCLDLLEELDWDVSLPCIIMPCFRRTPTTYHRSSTPSLWSYMVVIVLVSSIHDGLDPGRRHLCFPIV